MALAWPALATLLALVTYGVTTLQVGRARAAHRVRPPATHGPEAFERVLRVQLNTLEQLVFFLPSLWLAALFHNPRLAAALGFVWVGARIAYAIGYSRAVEQRAPGFVIGLFTSVVLLALALKGVIDLLI
ncbi:MAPEG family protein [Cyanobium sp. Morenito 9A2]|uniref:MAPEG family protein n=1 Tax=Cyanobium sp. Morenito 9A2 TaxID=2823718 RepID=UPI0020CC19F7|nr:MAPEG family protein [Cyanobium sp. Morenito 9A2]MCP9848692.1 MAPEG family protein [Cyanobium sp. Morenito 9A2]